ncbi:PaaX family transcriptional regulator [Rhodococcus opacus]|uniref:PaaX family transcriptional regulator n=1 Tax=Rhodococcus opacus TaxID=37919 RepID=A0ABT4NP99_RHOOP|nr:PaaX family transcriptional regulator C-terminal domain-containing protein [Rhodococcus opacus]MCZ4589204.1 PaaX family transcriptional regulator [Rhodococcus opacus]
MRDMFDVNLPPPSARSLLLTVVGELTHATEEEAWTTALLRVLGGLGIEQHAGRQLLARAASAKWLERERRGRAVHWRLAGKGRTLVSDGIRRSNAYLAGPPSWDGRWLLLFVTVPNQLRTTRKRLYGGLSWLGMGNPLSSVWTTPHVDRGDELTDLVQTLGLETSSLAVIGSVQAVGMTDREIVRTAWDLTGIAESYELLIAQLDAPTDLPDEDAVLLAYLRLLNVQQRLMRRDPFLPEELLPDWIGREGAQKIRQRREQWAPIAHARWAKIVQECAPD